jgi:hypothetical protein
MRALTLFESEHCRNPGFAFPLYRCKQSSISETLACIIKESIMAGEYFRTLVRGIIPLVTIVATADFAVAQGQPPAPEPQQKVQQENWQHTPSGKVGKEEPSSHAATDAVVTAAFINGALAVPGAPTDTDTIPAKFSQRNADDDKLITLAYTFKTLSQEQRRAVYQALKNQQGSANANAAEIGTELPPLGELRAVPQEVSARVPQTSGYQYLVANNRVLLVSAATRVVVGIFSEAD